MNCPRCSVPLTSSDAGITGQSCRQCAGLWVRLPELERGLREFAASKKVALKVIALLEGSATPTDQMCPECASPLHRVTLRGVRVEKCVPCQAVFLDRGEDQLIARRLILAAVMHDPEEHKLQEQVRLRLEELRHKRFVGWSPH